MHPEVWLLLNVFYGKLTTIPYSEGIKNKAAQLRVYSNSIAAAAAAATMLSENSSKFDNFIYESIKLISVHVPKHVRPKSDDEFGYYLAGLIDGDGWFSKYGAHIIFHSLDVSLAYYIRGRIGYGSVTKVKTQNAYILTIHKREGLEILLNLINCKLRTQSKCDAIYKYILNVNINPLHLKEKFEINTSTNLYNHWFAGFLDARGKFQVKCTEGTIPLGGTRMEIQLILEIYQKTHLLLDPIKDQFGGNIRYSKIKDTYYYSSTSFGSAINVISYLDKYHMLSSKHVNYLKWRKAYQLFQENKIYTPKERARLLRIESSMINYSKEIINLDA